MEEKVIDTAEEVLKVFSSRKFLFSDCMDSIVLILYFLFKIQNKNEEQISRIIDMIKTHIIDLKKELDEDGGDEMEGDPIEGKEFMACSFGFPKEVSDELLKSLEQACSSAVSKAARNIKKNCEESLAWRTMETAPRDGTYIIGVRNEFFSKKSNTPTTVYWEASAWREPFMGREIKSPHYWMPIPELKL